MRGSKGCSDCCQSPLLDFTKEDIVLLIALFENAKTFGSLIQVPPKLAEKLPLIQKRLDDVQALGDLTHSAARVLEPVLNQAKLLSQQYDAVVANPPYMGNKGMNEGLKSFARNISPKANQTSLRFSWKDC